MGPETEILLIGNQARQPHRPGAGHSDILANVSPIAKSLFQNPDWIDQELAERSLWEFTRQMWPWIDPAPFKDNWHLGCMAEHLEAVNLGQIPFLIINIPPRHMKSINVAVAWPVWTWIRKPTTRLLGPPCNSCLLLCSSSEHPGLGKVSPPHRQSKVPGAMG